MGTWASVYLWLYNKTNEVDNKYKLLSYTAHCPRLVLAYLVSDTVKKNLNENNYQRLD